MIRRALVTGVTGQDGSYLAEFLLKKGYEVHGFIRPERLVNPDLMPAYMRNLLPQITVHGVDLHDLETVSACCKAIEPDEVYHLGGPTRVDSNVSGGSDVFKVIFGSTRSLIVALSGMPHARFFLAGTSEMFGNPAETPQSETSQFNPRSLYGFAKLAAHDLVSRARDKRGQFACTGILYNHESPRREPFFLSRKVTRGLVRVALGRQSHVSLGNLDAVRDWGYAPEYVEAMWRMLQQDRPKDYVIATGTAHSVRDLVAASCGVLNLAAGDCIRQDPQFFRPLEPIPLRGDPSLIGREIGWAAQKPFAEIIREMIEADLEMEKTQ
jgi:GDPmannose 4,6-dehydratase